MANVFTPWLAANLARLGSEIGIDLELEGVEVAVGPYSADILATDLRNGGRVLIENQLEEGDHRHLGQIMTYLTGLDARTVVWVAPRFRPEHLSAIRWLNEHTSAGFNFFAVKLRVVRIGASPYAPLFEIVERPNDWDRQVQAAAQESSEASPVTLFRRDFWAFMSERHPEAGFKPGSASSQWYPVGETGVVVSAYVSQGGCGVFLRGGRGVDGRAMLARLEPVLDGIMTRLQVEVGDPQYPLSTDLKIDLSNRDVWPEAADWLVSQVRRYADVVTVVLDESVGA